MPFWSKIQSRLVDANEVHCQLYNGNQNRQTYVVYGEDQFCKNSIMIRVVLTIQFN